MTAILPELPHLLIHDAVKAALLEDLGRAGDITSQATIPPISTQPRFSSRASQVCSRGWRLRTRPCGSSIRRSGLKPS